MLSDTRRKIDGEVSIDNYSRLPMLPALHAFPVLRIHPCADIRAIHLIKPMHNLSLEVSRMLKDFLKNLFDDSERTAKINDDIHRKLQKL